MAVVDVKLVGEGDGGWAVYGAHSYRCVWRVLTDSVLDTAFVVLGDARLPRLGDEYAGWAYNPTTGAYTALVPAQDPNSVAVHLDPRQDGDNPQVWLVTVSYEGESDPRATPPEVVYDSVPYQEFAVQDAAGAVLTNSAFDPFDGGVQVDRHRTQLSIVRNVAIDKWNPSLTETFAGSRNAAPYQHADLIDAFGQPVVAPPGSAKLAHLSASREVRVKNPEATSAKYYWRVRAMIEFDNRTYVDEGGAERPVNWQTVLVDAGFNEVDPATGKKARIPDRHGVPVTTPQLLDGKGRRLRLPPDRPTVDPVEPADADDLYPLPENDFYAALSGRPLRVAAPGVMGNDTRAVSVTLDAGPAHGTLSFGDPPASGLGPDGSFTYTSTGGFSGWDTFTYTATNAEGDSNPATVLILVGPVPRVRVFNTRKTLDWDPIAHLIGW